ncbi:hypothetical protein AMS68_006456 [Peltaster fructicola]|uniref:Uncharacterized protein n=1 Tax=Peltaster fructicola TaxID=286661 RepID=A0A6H0Y242_9PEZI|nr:hypothetical protein AMS68_006456 [Peltaster fructicola]
MGNQLGKFSFWDLQKLESPYTTDNKPTLPVFAVKVKGIAKKTGRKRRADGEEIRPGLLHNLERETSVRSSVSRDTGTSTPSARPAQREVRSVLDDPLQQVKPHHVVAVAATDVAKDKFATYTTAWSPDGHWVVGVGDKTTLVMMYREKVR